ncbi:MAG TPA: hypothetical protein VMZ90_05885 [Vicinamibacterales bacterium]|nr:hypothetical protein [Vicinamibacterales bacterium]
MRRLLEAYQYVAPAVLTPLAGWLWWHHYDGHAGLAAIAFLVPIVHAYVVPGVGTNMLGVWEFDTRLRLGRFRPHHGFVFGSATSVLVLLTLAESNESASSGDLVQRGLVAAAVLGAVNWAYDVAAIRAGILKVYNQPWAEGEGASAIVTDYAPWFFGGFGFVYGAGLALAERFLAVDTDAIRSVTVGACLAGATITLPTLGYVLQSYARYGHHGCRPIPRRLEV